MSVSEPSTNPWQPALDEKIPAKAHPLPSLPHEDTGNNAWEGPSAGKAPLPRVDTQPVLIDIDEPESPAWDEDEPSPIKETSTNNIAEAQEIRNDRHAWDEAHGHPLQQNPPTLAAPQNKTFMAQEDTQQGEGWNLIDHEPSEQQSGIVSGSGAVLENFSPEERPTLPPRRSIEQPPAQPPRPSVNTSSSSLQNPGRAKQKKETYEIKKITWHDVNAAKNPRISPILVQNANGPCPLLALVNALTLSTPAEIDTALVETLRSREQVSLGLLLDAVFDELMSGRRGDAAQELPDVTELYSFLLTLHTGMNVNPRFFPPPPRSPNDPRNSMSHVHPSAREGSIPGTFEATLEMKMYSTFSVPLIHGWLPDAGSPAYAALQRSAQSYEDAQNLMFHEEELEDKLEREGLSFQEQGTLEDIATIKAFFASNATQLTYHGLETITTSLAPGAVAILFRNDHFSTLYRHPDTLQLLQLVTDLGYAGHEEVVWESLIDVNGENAEFFSGDFRLVGGAPAPSSSQAPHPAASGWTTVASRRNNNQPASSDTQRNTPPQSPTTEQEDHDLALALQLQEEEEERHRAELARRRRETELSQQYIEQQGSQASGTQVPVTQQPNRNARGGIVPGRGRGEELRPAIPPRRNNAGTSVNTTAPPQRVVDPEAGTDAPPPSYEQAASLEAYVPPSGHPAHPGASPNGSVAADRRASGIQSGNGARRRNTGPLIDQIPSGSGGRRNTAGLGAGQGVGGRDRDCCVM